ncbi:MAG: hypothetical protein K2W95_01555 [Candidatus Obscuribacterales bacterium]|nr:hypothetical protein [Candidatus Obscuribacterales bacterium]
MSDTKIGDTEKDESCVEGLSRKEFIKKVLEKAAVAGTLAAIVNSQISIHPAVAQLPTATAG